MNYKLPHKWVCFLVLLTSCFVSTIQQTERETKRKKIQCEYNLPRRWFLRYPLKSPAWGATLTQTEKCTVVNYSSLTLRIGCTTLSLNFLDMVTFSLISPSNYNRREKKIKSAVKLEKLFIKISYLQISKTLTFKTRLRVKPFLWK